MFSDLNKRIEEVKENQWKKRKYEEHIARIKTYLKQEQTKRQNLEKQLRKEQKDVKKLESVSLTNVFYTILGKKLEKLDKEQQEALAAQLKYEEAVATIAEVDAELSELTKKLHVVSNADSDYKQLLLEKERLIHDSNSIWCDELYEITDQKAEISATLKEYEEAIDAGNKAKAALSKAFSSLESAKGWSTWDMVGGGMISTAIKHSHLDDSKKHIHKAQTELRHFQEELSDVVNHDQMKLEIGGMLTFADYFFDGLIVDWMVHGKITDSLKQVEKTKRQVESVVNSLKKRKELKQQRLKDLIIKRQLVMDKAD
ncbi:MAG: hypothetical protein LRY71_00805 [Bacillaceae bacterium]|nr:hypothetical protein [Bacillaceae bacterium]